MSLQTARRGRALAIATAVLTASCAAAPKVDPSALNAASEAVKTADVAGMNCPELAQNRNDLVEKTAQAVVKPKSVDLTSPTGIAKAKDLSPGGTAASVAVTAAKSTIPGAGFIPLVTGSARREAKRNDAINNAKVTLARLEGAMLVKGCPIDGGEDATEAAPAAEPAAMSDAPAAATEPSPEPAAQN
jgi:hypothetical protein